MKKILALVTLAGALALGTGCSAVEIGTACTQIRGQAQVCK